MTNNTFFTKESPYFKDAEFLNKLLSAKSPSSYEKEALDVLNEKMTEIGLYKDYSDKIGNSGYTLGTGPKKIMISAHIDEIAMVVGTVEDNGMMILQNLAGIDKKVLPGAQVLVMNEDHNWIKGVIIKAPIHTENKGKETEKVIELDNLRLDVGASSADELQADYKIYPGSLVVLDRNINTEFGKNKIVGNALDDKIGIYIITRLAETLSMVENANFLNLYTIYFVACTQEESGLRGATIAAKNINPDISIDIDVTFAVDGGLVPKNKYGDIKLGKGVVVEYGQDKSRRLNEMFTKFAAMNSDISIQRGVARCGGTNTNTIQLSANDCETALLSIPNLSMHTQNEICDWRDVLSATDLLYGLITNEWL